MDGLPAGCGSRSAQPNRSMPATRWLRARKSDLSETSPWVEIEKAVRREAGRLPARDQYHRRICRDLHQRAGEGTGAHQPMARRAPRAECVGREVGAAALLGCDGALGGTADERPNAGTLR